MTIRRGLSATVAGALLVLEAAMPAMAAEPGHPSGTFTLDRTIAYLRVIDGDQSRPYGEGFRITPHDVTDDETAPEDLVLEVSRGDGSGFTEVPFPCTPQQCTITYDEPGSFSPHVRLTDEDGNVTNVDLPTIRVIRDTTAPVVRLTLPRPRARHRVSAWHVIRGTAIDGVGTASVDVEVLQKRRGRWYYLQQFYGKQTDTLSRRWVRGLPTEAATFAQRRPRSNITQLVGRDRWRTLWITGLTRGPLVVRVRAMDANFWETPYRKHAWVRLTRR